MTKEARVKDEKSPAEGRAMLIERGMSLQTVLQHDEGVRSHVERALLLSLDSLLLRRDGLLVVVVLIIGSTSEHRLDGRLLDTKATQVDVSLLCLARGITDLHVELARLHVEDDRLAIVHILLRLDDISGITLELHTVTIVVLTA